PLEVRHVLAIRFDELRKRNLASGVYCLPAVDLVLHIARPCRCIGLAGEGLRKRGIPQTPHLGAPSGAAPCKSCHSSAPAVQLWCSQHKYQLDRDCIETAPLLHHRLETQRQTSWL